MSVVQLFSASRTLYADGIATSVVIDLAKEIAQSKFEGRLAAILQCVVAHSGSGPLTPTALEIRGHTVKLDFASALPGNGTLAGGYVQVDLSLGIE